MKVPPFVGRKGGDGGGGTSCSRSKISSGDHIRPGAASIVEAYLGMLGNDSCTFAVDQAHWAGDTAVDLSTHLMAMSLPHCRDF